MIPAIYKLLLALVLYTPEIVHEKTLVEHAVSKDGIECVIVRLGGTSKTEIQCRDFLRKFGTPTYEKLPFYLVSF